MRLVLRRAAKRDLFEARRGYDDRQPGLGASFLTSIEAAFVTILHVGDTTSNAIGLMVRHAGTDTGRVPLTN